MGRRGEMGDWGEEGKEGREGKGGRGGEISPPQSFLKVGAYDPDSQLTATIVAII